MTDTVDKIAVQSTTQGVAESTRQVEGLSKAMDGVTVASEKTERSTLSVESRFKSLERQLGTTSGQQQKFEKVQNDVNKAVAQNPALQARANEVLKAAEARYLSTSKAVETLQKTTGLSRAELINYSRQIQDIGVSLFSGQSPLTVGVQQGAQIFDILSSSGVKFTDSLKQVGSVIAGVLTPVRLLTGGAVGLGAAALYIGNSWQEAAAEVDHALTGMGARSGTTAADIQNFAKANSSATGLSVSEARNAALEFTKTGNVAIAGLKGVGEAIKGYSILTGKDATEATKAFTDAISGDLYKGIVGLDQRYASLNAQSLEYIQTLISQGEKTKALQVFIDASAAANKRAEESVGLLAKAWNFVANIPSNLANLRLTSEKSPQEAVDDLVRRRDEFAGTSIGRNDRGELIAYESEAAKLEAFRKQIEEAQKALDSFNADSATAQIKAISSAAKQATDAIFPQIGAIHQLDEAIRNLQQSQANGNAPTYSSEALTVLQHQRTLQQESLDTLVRQSQVVTELQHAWSGVSSQTAVALNNLQGQLQVAQAVTGRAQMMAQYAATYNALLAQGVSALEAQAIASQQLAIAQAAATASVERQIESLRDQNAMIKAAQNGTEAQTAAAIAYKNAIASGADETSAAALRAETLKNHMLQASSAAGSFASNMYDGLQSLIAGAGVSIAGASGFMGGYSPALGPGMVSGGDTGSYRSNGGSFTPDIMGQRGQFSQGAPGQGQSQIFFPGSYALAPSSPTFSPVGQRDLATLQGNLAAALTQPQSYARDTTIKMLQDAIERLTKSTDALNDTNKATLNPLYNGKDALKLGYYHAATGLSGVVQGPPGIDTVPVHMMLTAGERVEVTPAGQPASNDNSRSVVNNNTFVFNGGQSRSRRNARQVAQGFGQTMAALS